MSYFPMFVDLENRIFLVIGGGNIAFHKVKVLSDFKAKIKVIAPDVKAEIKQLPQVEYEEKMFEIKDLDEIEFVVIATDDKSLNHQIALECKNRKLMYNTVDQMEDCKFIFPSYVKEKDLVVGISSSGKSPLITQYLKDQIRKIVTSELSDVTDFLGELRPQIKQEIQVEKNRKKVYQNLLNIFLKQKKIPNEVQICEVIEEMKKVEVCQRKLDGM